MSKNKKESIPILNEDEKAERYVVIEGANYISAKHGVAVYDNHGKRRIGKNNRVQVSLRDKVVYDEEEYILVIFTDTHAILKKR